MRYSDNEYVDSKLLNGYDYDNQAWVVDGKYVRCGHPETMGRSQIAARRKGRESMSQEYIIRCHPKDKKWYVCGYVGDGKYIPISNGSESYLDALKDQHRYQVAKKDQINCLKGI